MRRGVYFGVSAAVAVAGAGLVAVAPVTRPLPNVQAPAIELSSGSVPKVDQQYLEWWQTVTGDIAPPPSLNEVTDFDPGSVVPDPDEDVPPPVTLRVDDFAATPEPAA